MVDKLLDLLIDKTLNNQIKWETNNTSKQEISYILKLNNKKIIIYSHGATRKMIMATKTININDSFVNIDYKDTKFLELFNIIHSKFKIENLINESIEELENNYTERIKE